MSISELKGKTLTECVGEKGGETVVFKTTEGKIYQLAHIQDCCESVTVEDICGDLNDLVGSPIIQAEETVSKDKLPGGEPLYAERFTWTFYRLATAKGFVTIRFYGESNGYYSESVDFAEIS